MPAQYIPSSNEQQSNPSEALQLVLLLKRQAIEQKIAEHRLNVLGPLEDEFAKTNLALTQFKLQEARDTAPLTQRRESALTTSAEFDVKNQPELYALQKKGAEARIGSETAQQKSAEISQRASEQLIGQREKAFPVEQQTAQLAQDATRQQIAASQEQTKSLISTRENQKKELSLQKEQLVLHAAQTREGIMLLKNHPDFARDPEMRAYISILPDDVDPKSTDEFLARSLHNLMLSNNPLLANLKYEVLQGLPDRISGGRGDKAQALMEALGAGGATDVTKRELADAIGKAYAQTRQQGPSQDQGASGTGEGVTGDVFSTQPSTLKKGELGPEQVTQQVKALVKVSNDAAPRTEEHIKQNRRFALMTEDKAVEIPLGSMGIQGGGVATVPTKGWKKFLAGIPVDPSSGLKLEPTDGSLIVGKAANPYHDENDLKLFVKASMPDEKATGAQRARFTTLLSDLAKVEDPDPQLLLGIIGSGKFTNEQISNLLDLGNSLGWRMDVVTTALDRVKKVQGAK